MRYRLGWNTQLYAQGNVDAANFIIITISRKIRSRGQGAKAITQLTPAHTLNQNNHQSPYKR
jgi:hypothetical protein